MTAFEDEGIEFTFPSTTAYLARENKRPLHINLSGGFNLKDLILRIVTKIKLHDIYIT
jgi:hypothetical protein